MENYYVNGSLTNYIQGSLGFNAYQGSIVYQPFNDDMPFLLDVPGQGVSEIGFTQEQALYNIKLLLKAIGFFPLP
jgi:hypothetical protein